jgi:hypothetical protein
MSVLRGPNCHLDVPFRTSDKFVESNDFGFVKATSKQLETPELVCNRASGRTRKLRKRTRDNE